MKVRNMLLATLFFAKYKNVLYTVTRIADDKKSMEIKTTSNAAAQIESMDAVPFQVGDKLRYDWTLQELVSL